MSSNLKIFYKHKKQRDKFNEVRNKMNHMACDTSIMGKIETQDRRLDQLYDSAYLKKK